MKTVRKYLQAQIPLSTYEKLDFLAKFHIRKRPNMVTYLIEEAYKKHVKEHENKDALPSQD